MLADTIQYIGQIGDNMKKKVLALILCAVMTLSSAGVVSASALETDETILGDSLDAVEDSEDPAENVLGTEEAETDLEEELSEDLDEALDDTEDSEDISEDVPADETPDTAEETGETEEINDEEEVVLEAGQTGWVQSGSDWKYKEESGYAVGLTQINGSYYYFDASGILQTGWQHINGKTYYFKKSGGVGVLGLMHTGVRTVKNKKFYFHKTKGFMMTGWKKIDGSIYYFWPTGEDGAKGRMITGWRKIDGLVYYFKASGKRLTGWKKIDNQIYYFKKGGKVGDAGQVLRGLQKIDGKYFYFQKSGRVKTIGKLVTGPVTINGKTYFFKRTGRVGTRGMRMTGWQKSADGKWYYLASNGVAKKSSWLHQKGYWYYLDSDGHMSTGWTYVSTPDAHCSTMKFYFRPKKSGSSPAGSLVQDVSSIIGTQSSYYTTVDRTRCTVTVYAKDTNGEYRIPVKTMTCSVGLPATPTPTGTFSTSVKYRWKELMGPSWGQYATRIVGGVLFHSVAGSAANSYALPAAEYNKLGSPASHGCVRLCVRDAKWIYDNCPLGMTVRIGDNLYAPFDKPATIKIPASQTYDPTDPAV